eukprot:TRINITY_DN12553_c0_g1_i1.p1 TRINITY_DN12553_c0_g1~~TRINITY_DN12553_c0_g1_i1.p1  ORF type:complete len:126 (-),score=35.18 TRINITY_DN12553_c0_g1_i1:10-387(-)
MIRRPPRSTQSRSSAASDVYKRQALLLFDQKLPDNYERVFTRPATAENSKPHHAAITIPLLPNSDRPLLPIHNETSSSQQFSHYKLNPVFLPRYSRRELSQVVPCLLYTSPSPRDGLLSRMPSSA